MKVASAFAVSTAMACGCGLLLRAPTASSFSIASAAIKPPSLALLPPSGFRRRTAAAGTAPMRMSAASSAAPVNRLLSVPRLKHSYYALRHGQSLANVAGIISSDPSISTVQHGLSEFGHEQARDAGEAFAREFLGESGGTKSGGVSPSSSLPYRGVAVYSSDFTRARETAQHLADALTRSSILVYGGGVVLETRLRERNFGELNGGPDSRYPDVWAVDASDAWHNEFGVESVNSVVERTTGLVLELEADLTEEGEKPWKCVLVAHGDVLQIMQTGFGKIDGTLHRTLPHLETATVRELSLGG